MTDIDTTQSPLGAAVRSRMAALGLSQRKLAKASGVPQASLSDLLSGKIASLRMDNIQSLAGALETSVGELLGEPPSVSDTAAAVLVPLDRLCASPLNPRKHFDHDDLMELAASLRAQGVLQPLTVRPDAQRPDGFEVVIGGRRLRAAELLVEDDHWRADHPVPVTIVEIDDAGALAMATAENVQREDMHPLEEAEAFLALRRLGRSTADIAATVGKTQRWVQERLRIAETLDPTSKERFASGVLSLAEARELSRAPAPVQLAVLAKVEKRKRDNWPCDAAVVRGMMTDPFPPVSAAIFDRTLYDGETIASGGAIESSDDYELDDVDEESDDERFADVEQFHRLQEAAIAEKTAQLSEKWPWVDRVEENQWWTPDRWSSEYTTKKADGTGEPGAVVHVDSQTMAVKVHGKIWRKQKASSKRRGAKTTGEPVERDPVERIGAGRRVLARNVKTRVLQNALSADFTVALQVACAALMGAHAACRIHVSPPNNADQGVFAPELQAVFKVLAKTLNADRKTKLVGWSDGDGRIQAVGGSWRDKDHLIFEAVRGLSTADLQVLFAALVASCTGSFAGYGGSHLPLGDDSIAIAIADALGTATEAYWRIDADYLDKLTKGELTALGWRIGMTGLHGMPAVMPINELMKMRAKDLRIEVLRYVEANDIRHVPPEMQIVGTMAAEAGIRREAKEAGG